MPETNWVKKPDKVRERLDLRKQYGGGVWSTKIN